MTNKNKKYALVETYGCQQNASDSEKIKGILVNMGYEMTDERGAADIIIFNTCAVRDSAEQRVLGNIGALKAYKKQKPLLKIGICGCMTQQEQTAQDIRKKFPFVDMIFGTFALYKLPQIIHNCVVLNQKVTDISDEGADTVAENLPVLRENKIKANVTVMYGCNNFCSYCIVPYVRGRERSRRSDEILKEITELVKDGYKEITLLGQNVNSYGKDIEGNLNFSSLLEKISEINGDFWIRFITSHPKDANNELFDVIAKSEKLCSHIHLPVQSGCDEILNKMNRKYTSNDYLTLIKNAKKIIKDVSLTSDIIVGFPGETEQNFEDTLKLVSEVRFDMLFTFLYSKRKGTAAADFDGVVADDIKQNRFRRLLDTQNEISLSINEKYLNRTVKVLVDGVSETNKEVLSGRTESNKVVNFTSDKSHIGEFVNVKITDFKTWSLFGKME